MRYFYGWSIGCLLLLGSCAHPIVITPDLDKIDRGAVKPIDKAVGYFIAPADRDRVVQTPGGGGDKVEYYPYRELEPALQKVLYNLFRRVKRLDRPDDSAAVQSNQLAFVFRPTVTTNSSSSSALTWPPTRFTVRLDCTAYDPQGKITWEWSTEQTGTAEFEEFKSDFSLSAKRATAAAFQRLQADMNTAPALRN